MQKTPWYEMWPTSDDSFLPNLFKDVCHERLMIIRKFEYNHDMRIYSLSDKRFSSKVATKAFDQVQEHHKESLV